MLAISTTHPGAIPGALAPIPATPLGRARGLALAGSLLVGVFVIGFGVWATYAPLESASVGPGTVESESSRKTVQHLEGGIIGQILVHDGDEVRTGQVLLRLDETKARTTLEALQGQLWDALAREARLVAERDGQSKVEFPERLTSQAASNPAIAQVIAGQQKIFETRRSLLQSKTDVIRQRIAQVREEIVGLKAQEAAAHKRVGFANEEMSGIKTLLEKGLERKPRKLQLDRDIAEMEGKRGEMQAAIARANQTIAESEVTILNQQNDTANEVANDLRDTQKKIHELSEQIQAARDVLARIDIKAPQDGVVTDMKVHTIGGVIQQGEALMDLVPKEDKLIVKVQVKPEDINVVRAGLDAHVRFTPYKQRRTPPIEGKVIYVSADKLVDKKTNASYYEAKIRMSEAELEKEKVELVPGMPAEAMIKTGETTVALYALSPVLDGFHRAFREK
jgi:HlyD family secretion protein